MAEPGAWRKSVRYAAPGGIALALLTLACFRAHIGLASAIPFYILLVVIQSLNGDFVSAAAIAVLSGLCLDFFFTAPLFSFYMSSPLDVFATIAFVLTALVITKLVSRVRREAAATLAHGERLDRLYQLSQRLLGLGPESSVSEMFPEPFHRLFGVDAICIFDAGTTQTRTIGSPRHELANRTHDAYIGSTDVNDPRTHIFAGRLLSGGRLTGAIGFEGLQEPIETMATLKSLTNAFLEREQAFREVRAAEAAAQAEVYRTAVPDALAHEFKTPITTILAATAGLRETGPLAAVQGALVETIEDESERLGSLTSSLLRMARLDREQVRPRLELTDISELVACVAAQHFGRYPDRRIGVSGAGEIPAVFVDPELFRLTLSQLVDNACRYSETGSTVNIGIGRRDDFISVTVSNSGSSVQPAERFRIFERFYRGTDVKQSTPGSGLGLYVARKIALAHGGSLELETGDVTFCLKIPAVRKEIPSVLAAG